MNAKKSKLLRKFVDNMGQNPNHTEYQINEKTGAIELKPTCGRAIYQRLKKRR